MIGKLIVHRPTRDEALNAMTGALREFYIEPTKTTIPLHDRLINDEGFRTNKTDIGYVERLLEA